jgi:hypothetical protein
MVRHAVLITRTPGTSAEAVAAAQAGLDALPGQVGRIARYTHGRHLGLGTPRSDHAIVADYETVDDWRHSDAHEYHGWLRAELIGPIAASRTSCPFEVP